MSRIDGKNFLAAIIKEKRAEISLLEKKMSIKSLDRMAAKRKHRSLIASLKQNSPAIIAEVKKASPSAGVIVQDYNPAKIASLYEKGGAAAISVLTENKYFLGNIEHLQLVRDAVSLPLLRKDFICDVYQVHEAAAFSADAVLLIAAALTVDEIKTLYNESISLGLEVIIEVHSAVELNIALQFESAVIGVNNRNLSTLTTDLSTAVKMAKLIPVNRISIAESGIKSRFDVERLMKAGYKGFLIGESLLRSKNPEMLLKSFLFKYDY